VVRGEISGRSLNIGQLAETGEDKDGRHEDAADQYDDIVYGDPPSPALD
jgi:hypothetical protein